MAIIKKSAATPTKVTVTDYIYVCNKCGYANTSKRKHKEVKPCPNCAEGELQLVDNSAK